GLRWWPGRGDRRAPPGIARCARSRGDIGSLRDFGWRLCVCLFPGRFLGDRFRFGPGWFLRSVKFRLGPGRLTWGLRIRVRPRFRREWSRLVFHWLVL